jgi:GDP-4-dehydro-6-deoxy-D-mannose reductase
MKGRALVTGAAGFVGTTLCAHLEAQGWEAVRVVQTGQTGGIPTDITQPGLLEEVFSQAGALTHVFHLAAIAFVPMANDNPVLAMEVNLNGTINVAGAMRKHAPAARMIFISSSDAYGAPLSLPMTESHPLDPVNAYSISKAAADHYCAYLHKSLGVDVIRMRPFNHSGPRQEAAFFLPSCARQIAEIEAGARPPIIQVGNLAAARDFLHVDDVIRAFEAAALRGMSGEAYNVCSGRSWTMAQVLEMLISRSTAEITTEIDPARVRPVDVPNVVGCSEKLRFETGWAPQKSFENLLDDLLDYWRGRVLLELGGK